MTTDIFRDIELEAANEMLREPPCDIPVVGIAIPEGLSHDANGVPRFDNRPTGAQLVEQINRTHGIQHDAAQLAAEQEREARRSRGLAYQTAARCLAETNHDVSSSQMNEIDRLAKQIYQTGTRLLRKR